MEGNDKITLESVIRLKKIVARLRSENGCPWDRAQTHESLKPACIEEAAEVLGGIDILKDTGKDENLKEELGDLLLQVVFHAQLAEEEGLFSLADVAETVSAKMIRRHPHVFHEPMLDENGRPLTEWKEIKAQEKKGREWEEDYLPQAFAEAETLIDKAKKRKGIS
ncbi:MazG nucleotide pyrophosphohydrolase domain-containing protein [Mitsuokella sp. WILCCON 0060]|uniref:MazG nucleotide pyrophosphohydrolase domain-containing protein n=1 Tax=Mitsuokella sp. WILCCON 0060 TaxID=3345341 RepID=UPI003F19A5DB